MEFQTLITMSLEDITSLAGCLGWHDKLNLVVNIRRLLYLRRSWYTIQLDKTLSYGLTLEEEYAVIAYKYTLSQEPDHSLITFIKSNFTLLKRQEEFYKNKMNVFYHEN